MKILNALNPLASCRKYHISTWQCPQFLFLIMGAIIIVAIIATYIIASMEIGNPMLVSLIVLSVASVLVIIDFIITGSIERIAEASRMKTEFISIVSHQLRAPLTNIRFSLDALISEKLVKDEKNAEDYIEILQENIKNMGDLINDLLTVSRIESKELPLKKTSISLLAVTKKIIMDFKSFSEASNVKIKFVPEKNVSNVAADELWLKQVVENLIDNAVRYTKGGGIVRVKIYQKDKKVYFEIQDQGVGIPKEEQKYIFQKFFRSKNALQHQTGGSGLGLHIAKKTLEMIGGKIWFKSEENKGTSFYFTLPAKAQDTKGLKN